MADVDHLAPRGTLWLKEPIEVESLIMHYPELGILAEPAVRQGPLQMLAHPVRLHLVRVLDYSAQPGHSPASNNSFHSNASGIPSDGSYSGDGPVTWGYRWTLEFDDGTFPPPLTTEARSTPGYASQMTETATEALQVVGGIPMVAAERAEALGIVGRRPMAAVAVVISTTWVLRPHRLAAMVVGGEKGPPRLNQSWLCRPLSLICMALSLLLPCLALLWWATTHCMACMHARL